MSDPTCSKVENVAQDPVQWRKPAVKCTSDKHLSHWVADADPV